MRTQFGAMIVSGPRNWSIIQQNKGQASVFFSGTWSIPEEVTYQTVQVYVRWLYESDSSIVIPWQPAKMLDSTSWELHMNHVPVGGLYRIETCLQVDASSPSEWAIRGDMIHHVGVGDIWVIAGQSNSAGYGKGPFKDDPQLGVHLFRNDGNWDLATHPFNDSTNTLHILNREFCNPGHSPYLVFGKWIQQNTHQPIGFIQAALGGSPLRRWNPEEEGDLYRNMIEMIEAVGGKIKGVLWYQGESDCNLEEAESYLRRFHTMVQYLRKDLNEPELPFLTVQLNRYTGASSMEEVSKRSWGMVREAQRQAAEQISDIYVIPSLDCPLSDEIHNSPAGNMLIGERLAKSALAYIYKQIPSFHAPRFYSAQYSQRETKHILTIHFSHVQGNLTMMGPLNPVFCIEDEEGEIAQIGWTFSGKDKIEVELSRETQGESFVHGGYETNPSFYVPTDTATYMPMLAFYLQPIERK